MGYINETALGIHTDSHSCFQMQLKQRWQMILGRVSSEFFFTWVRVHEKIRLNLKLDQVLYQPYIFMHGQMYNLTCHSKPKCIFQLLRSYPCSSVFSSSFLLCSHSSCVSTVILLPFRQPQCHCWRPHRHSRHSSVSILILDKAFPGVMLALPLPPVRGEEQKCRPIDPLYFGV